MLQMDAVNFKNYSKQHNIQLNSYFSFSLVYQIVSENASSQKKKESISFE